MCFHFHKYYKQVKVSGKAHKGVVKEVHNAFS